MCVWMSGSAVLLDSSLPTRAAAHYQPVTSQPPPQTILGIVVSLLLYWWLCLRGLLTTKQYTRLPGKSHLQHELLCVEQTLLTHCFCGHFGCLNCLLVFISTRHSETHCVVIGELDLLIVETRHLLQAMSYSLVFWKFWNAWQINTDMAVIQTEAAHLQCR